MENKDIFQTQEFLLRVADNLKFESIMDEFGNRLMRRLKKDKLKSDRKQKLNQINEI